ncbi:MAG: Rossmann-like and DUF2520 domain-containing protein [Planctomycetota bacterium]
MKTLNVIGCGNVGKAISRLWAGHNVLEVRSILNRSLESSSRAVEFVGSGRAVESYAQMERADLLMISACDRAIEECCRELCRTGLIEEGVIVFHCSGSLPSTLLQPASKQGASIASLHPVKSFANPSIAVETFAGTFCALEGDPRACDVLRDAMHRCGATTFPVKAELKTIYHAATVVVCNYLVALMEVGLRCFEQAGLPRETALEVIEPIVTGTVDNVLKLGPVRALTGPIARGETSVVQRQCEALGQWDERIRRVYQALGQVAVELSAAQGNAGPDALAAIENVLDGESL